MMCGHPVFFLTLALLLHAPPQGFSPGAPFRNIATEAVLVGEGCKHVQECAAG